MVMGSPARESEVVVVGAGPGGYVAAIRAADLGKEVVLVEERANLGGVCLLEGCIPSKALIHSVEVIHAAKDAKKMGLTFAPPAVDLEALRRWIGSVVGDLSNGVAGLLKRRGVEVIRGRARFESDRTLTVADAETPRVAFRKCILATGARATTLVGTDGLGLWTAADALALPEIPDSLLVIGGGYIGLELGLVYAGLGAKVSVVEILPNLLTGADPDLVQVVQRVASRQLAEILLEARIAGVERTSAGYAVKIEHKGEVKTREYARVMASVGRRPNTDEIGLDRAGVTTDQRGFVPVNEKCQTSAPHIFAVGDITPGPMLAHRASRQGKVAAEVIAGRPAAFDNRTVPAVVFTDPEIAWAGLTELEAKSQGLKVTVGKFPLAALGRAKTMGRTEGFAKVLADPDTQLVLGVGIVGPRASDLIAEATLAIEMGATLEDLMSTIHPHPTLSEAVMEAAEVAAGAAVHIYIKKP